MLPEHLWYIVYDYLDDLTLIKYHNISKSLRSCLPHRVPVGEFMQLSAFRADVMSSLKNIETKPLYIRSLSWTVRDRLDAEVLLNKISSMRDCLLNHTVAYPNAITTGWAPSMIDVMGLAYTLNRPPTKTKRWYHSTYVMTSYSAFPRKRHMKGGVFLRPERKLVQERVVPAPLERECYTDKMAVFQKVKFFCGKLYSTSPSRPYMPKGFTYKILGEQDLLDQFNNERSVKRFYVPFTKWYQDGDWWTTLLVNLRDGHRMEYRAQRPQFVNYTGTLYQDCLV
jgi:hypothetical protein